MKRIWPILLAAAVLAASCSSDTADSSTSTAEGVATATPTTAATETVPSAAPEQVTAERLVPEVISARPHDPGAWTQGLIMYGDRMFESTGATGALSTLREVDPVSGEIQRILTIDEPYYAEGLERVDDRLIQLTWQNGLAFEYDLESFDRLQAFNYGGEGWGLCLDGERLVMSDGTDQLQFRDPASFEEIAPRVSVTLDGQPVPRLNELECVGGTVWANVWQTDTIVGIDPASGAVTAVVDASGLERPAEASVLNGIAYDPATGNYLLSGKWWPTVYEVRFVPAG